MNRLKKTTMLVLTMILIPAAASAEVRITKGDESGNLEKVFAAQGANNPVTMLFRAHLSQQEGRLKEAILQYQEVVQNWPSESKWGRIARLDLAQCLLCERPSDYARAEKVLHDISVGSTGDSAFTREVQLWRLVIELNKQADLWIQSGNGTIAENLDEGISGWRIPGRLCNSFSRSVLSLLDRFLLADKAITGAEFLRATLAHLKNRQLQEGVLREMISICKQANRPADALVAARAYWLLTVEDPVKLPEAIELVLSCVKLLGAGDAEVEKFRLLQMYGNRQQVKDSEKSRTLVGDLLRRYDCPSLIPLSVIKSQTTLLERARSCLLNGDLLEAIPLIKRQIQTSRENTAEREQGLELARMAIALYDGHVHAIDRYERYLYQKQAILPEGGKPTLGDPLDEILEKEKNRAIHK